MRIPIQYTEIMLHFLLITYIKIFAATSPLPFVVLYLNLRPSDTPEQRWALAKKGMFFASFIILGVLICGVRMLNLLQVDLNAFRISGGLILLNIAIGMLYPKPNKPTAQLTSDDITLTPLAFPIIAGPGALSAIIIYQSDAITTLEHCMVYVSSALIMATYYVLFYIACFSSKWLTPGIIAICSKLFGLLLLTISVQMITIGIIGLTQVLASC